MEVNNTERKTKRPKEIPIVWCRIKLARGRYEKFCYCFCYSCYVDYLTTSYCYVL